jgi:DNA repair ATPase RecN
MQNAHYIDDYSISSSLSDEEIYINIIDNSTIHYISFVKTIDLQELQELQSNISLVDAYTIITKCFNKKDKCYTVTIKEINDGLKINFDSLLGGFMKFNFDISLKINTTPDEKNTDELKKISNRCNSLEKNIDELKKISDKCNYLEKIIHIYDDRFNKLENIIEEHIDRIDGIGSVIENTIKNNNNRFKKIEDIIEKSNGKFEEFEYMISEDIDRLEQKRFKFF